MRTAGLCCHLMYFCVLLHAAGVAAAAVATYRITNPVALHVGVVPSSLLRRCSLHYCWTRRHAGTFGRDMLVWASAAALYLRFTGRAMLFLVPISRYVL